MVNEAVVTTKAVEAIRANSAKVANGADASNTANQAAEMKKIRLASLSSGFYFHPWVRGAWVEVFDFFSEVRWAWFEVSDFFFKSEELEFGFEKLILSQGIGLPYFMLS